MASRHSVSHRSFARALAVAPVVVVAAALTPAQAASAAISHAGTAVGGIAPAGLESVLPLGMLGLALVIATVAASVYRDRVRRDE